LASQSPYLGRGSLLQESLAGLAAAEPMAEQRQGKAMHSGSREHLHKGLNHAIRALFKVEKQSPIGPAHQPPRKSNGGRSLRKTRTEQGQCKPAAQNAIMLHQLIV